MFLIEFSEEPLEYPFDDSSIPAAPGRLVLGKSEEEFLANLSVWRKSDYRSHWARELKAFIEGNPKVGLVVSYNDSTAPSNVELWLVYRGEEWAYFQNQILSYNDLPSDFDISEISQYIDDREITATTRDRISEWIVPLRDIELFLRRSGGG